MLLRKQNGTFANYFQIFLPVRNVLFASSCSGIKKELLYFQKMISKRNQNVTIAPGFFKDKTKRLDNLKKFWKRNKTKAFGPKI
jgi:hypothetical protein